MGNAFIRGQAFANGSTFDQILRRLGRGSLFLAALTMFVVVTEGMIYHGKSVGYALWLALVSCVPVFVLLGVHLFGAMYRRVAEPRTATGITVFLLFQFLSYAALFLLALPWYLVLIPAYLLTRFMAGKLRERRAAARAKLAGETSPGA